MPAPQKLVLRRNPPAYATEPARYSAWCGKVYVGSIGHDPNGTTDQKWAWSLTILVRAMTSGNHHGRAGDLEEAMLALRSAFDGAGIDLEAARHEQRGVEIQRAYWFLHRNGIPAALKVEMVEGHASNGEIEAAHRASLHELAISGIETVQQLRDHRDAYWRMLKKGDDVAGMLWDRVQIAANQAMTAECRVVLNVG